MVYQIKAIKAKKMNIRQVRDELLKEAKKQGKENEKLLEQTWATWEGDKPKAETLLEVSREDVVILTEPNGSTEALNKFKWLDKGTSKRYAIMSSNWKSKTKPGVLKSGRGRGKVVVVGKRRIRRPRPGIQARGWTEKIQKRRKKPFINGMIKAKNRGADRLYK